MHNHTNVVPQVETDFITTARDLMTDRSKAVSLFTVQRGDRQQQTF